MGKLSAVSCASWVLAGCSVVNLTTAADQGAYTTRVAEDELFIDGRELRCDLFFCANGGVQQVAPRGTKVKQELQPVVWQFSGLLPVSDYLRTVAIHSVATEQKVRPWQDVQKTFYDGLLVEGANDADAKIAFAGAYAFAPRWSLVCLLYTSPSPRDQRGSRMPSSA